MNWNWDHIRFFLALADEGTLSAAARSLQVSHSTVLRRIRQMETQLNTNLFDHTHSGYSLTPAGKTLFSETTKMQATLLALSREISGADNHMDGEVIITTTDTLAKYIVPDLMAKLSDQHPGIRLSMFMANRINDMDSRDADIAIRTCKQPPEHLIGRKVAEIRFTAVASQSYVAEHNLKAFPDDLNKHKVIMLDETYSAAPFYQWLEQRTDRNTQITTVNNFITAAAMAKAGMGITVVPAYVLANESGLVQLETDDEISRNDLWVLSHADSRNTKRIRTTCRFLYEELSRKFN